MINDIGLIDVLLLMGISQGVFLTVTLPIVHQKNTKPNSILSIQLAMTSILLLSKFILTKATESWVIQYASTLEFIIFLFGPLGYMYIRRLLIKGDQNFILSWFHYVPAIFYGLFLLYLCSYSQAEYVALYRGGYLRVIFSAVEALALISNVYYLFRCGKLIFNFEKNEKEQLSFSQPSLRFLKVMFGGIALILMLWAFSFITSIAFGFNNAYLNYNTVWIALPLLVYGIGFYALRQPEIFRVQLAQKENAKQKNRLDETETRELQSSLHTLIHKEHIYLDNELTLAVLAEQLNTSPNNLSWLLNNVYNSNFYDYINQFRVAAFLEKLDKKEHQRQTLLALSMEVGFKSKSTFNKAFKAKLQETPSNYIKRLHAQSV
ncbi:helix-turn-helix domain-containing protein [Maribacter sp. 2210JD10-5]|uniref:helix-turn-helix domain-containing protein n=1 Tax=Maribacter sp. 2210JD10-5 TaxID=3386272 RepID=UPI0039BCE6B4